ncbi:MAG TPA: polysaccharide deacetylase family protein [Rubrobacteraceae bacterium]|nr:polysaccharide deacetylase family protein [Rubrobacteraceae bacterium]
MRHPRAHAWEAVAGLAAGGLALAGVRTATGRPLLSPSTLAAGGLGLAAGGLMVYEWLTPRSWLYGPVFWHARTTERVVALTFDDGPCHPYTGQLLDVLEREDIRATFFQVGNNVVREPSLAAEVASIHAVGNHSFTHPHLTWSRPRTIRDELERAQDAIHDATGALPNIFRVPHGWYGPQTISVAEDLGFRCVGWSVMAWDWDKPPREKIQHRILRGIGPGGVSLLHDGQDTDAFPKADRSRTIAAVPYIIEHLREAGYRFLTLPELMALDARADRP